MQRNSSRRQGTSRCVLVPSKPVPKRPTAVVTTDTDNPSSTSLARQDNFDRVAEMARDAYRIGKEILGELNVEDKIYTYGTTNGTPDWSNGGLYNITLNAVPQSVNEAGRTGDSIEMKGIRIAFRINTNKTSWGVNEANYCRITVVYHEEASQQTSLPFPTNASSVDGLWDIAFKATSMAPIAPRDYDSKARDDIIWDHLVKADAQNPSHLFHVYIPLKGKHTQFENDSSTINTGSLSLWFTTDRAIAADSMTVDFTSRLYFVDN